MVYGSYIFDKFGFCSENSLVPRDSGCIVIYAVGFYEMKHIFKRKTLAGWGYVVTYVHGHYLKQHCYAFGNVKLNPRSSKYFGARKLSKKTAELSSIANALVYVFNLSGIDEARIRTTSKNCITILKRDHTRFDTCPMTKTVQKLIRDIRSTGVDLIFEYVSPTKRHCFTEMATELSYEGAGL